MQIWKESLVSMSEQISVNAENEKILSTLGLCAKAGKLIFGVPMICEAMKKRQKPALVIIACDASEKTRNKLLFKSEFYEIKAIVSEATKDELSQIVGKECDIAATAITDEGFAAELLKLSGKDASSFKEAGIL